MKSIPISISSLAALLSLVPGSSFAAPPASFRIVDATSGNPLPCRIHVKDRTGKAFHPDSLPFFADHFSCDGTAALRLPPGSYTYLVERGPEYTRCRGSFEVAGEKSVEISEKLRRIADMAAEGWWSGELHVHRPAGDMPLLMRAEDLHVAPVITWWNRRNPWASSKLPENPLVCFDANRCYRVLGGEDERQGGAFMYFNLKEPIDITRAEREHPSPIRFLEDAARLPGAWIDIEKPFWWDVPVALAHGFGNSIGLANNHIYHSGMLDNEAWGRPRDREKYPSPKGNGLWSQAIYYHVLNSGLRIPPSAGSASGVLPNPLGYNRVYVHIDGPFSYDRWWQGLREGRCFVTNGPLLRVTVGGHPPGHVFRADGGEPVDLEIRAVLQGNDPVPFIEIVKNGAVERSVPSAEVKESGHLGRVRFERSGWLIVRAVADVKETYRFASTGPYHVEIGEEKHFLSRTSVRFFLDWVEERMRGIKIDDPTKLKDVLRYHEAAKRFWQKRLDLANAE